MTKRKKTLSKAEIATGFTGELDEKFGPIITSAQLAEIVGVGRSTIYEWTDKGRLDGAFRKRGKHVLIWRDRAIEILFNGPDWTKETM